MKTTLQQLFEEFKIESEYVKKVRPETMRGYAQSFQLFIKLLPEITVDTLSSNTVARFFKILQERKRVVGKGIVKIGVKKSTIATYWKNLNVFFEWLVTRNYLLTNPFKGMRSPLPVYEERKYLKKEEIERIIVAILMHHNNILVLKRNLALFYILLFCGVRRQELLSLKVRDIDFERKVVTIQGDSSKSGRTRHIPLHSSVIMHLKDYLKARNDFKSEYLFVSYSRDERLTINGLVHLIQKLRYWSGVEFHLHQLRHTFAINFLHASNNIAKLKQLLGHKNISMTLIYLRCLPINEIRGDIENMAIDTLL